MDLRALDVVIVADRLHLILILVTTHLTHHMEGQALLHLLHHRLDSTTTFLDLAVRHHLRLRVSMALCLTTHTTITRLVEDATTTADTPVAEADPMEALAADPPVHLNGFKH